MRAFTDSAGRAWTLSLTLDAAKRVKSLLSVNLLELDKGDPPLLTKLGTDVILLCDVVFAILKPQAEAAGVTDEQFGGALGGDIILAAQTAFYEEMVDFFQKLGRADLAKAVEAQRRIIELEIRRMEVGIGMAQTKLQTRIERADLESQIDAALDQTLGKSSISSPPSSESIQGP